MVEQKIPDIQPPQADSSDDDADFEALKAAAANMPKRTDEEVEAELDEWLKHPLNCKEVTPEMLEMPEY